MTALIMALSAVPAVEARAQSDETVRDSSVDLETSVSEILDANPGSVRLDDNDVLLEPGVMWSLPSDGDDGAVGAQALADCPAGWLCGWTHADYEGGRIAVQQGVYLHFLNWYWNEDNYQVKECDPLNCSLGPGRWRFLTNSITSVFNNTWSITWAPFYSPRNNANYYALRGAPEDYVGSKWNDSFTEMCGCP